jgi:hypothetical protein
MNPEVKKGLQELSNKELLNLYVQCYCSYMKTGNKVDLEEIGDIGYVVLERMGEWKSNNVI